MRFIRDEKDCAAWAAEQTVTLGGGPPGDPNGEKAALAVEGLVRKYECGSGRENMRAALLDAYTLGREAVIARVFELEQRCGMFEEQADLDTIRMGRMAERVQAFQEQNRRLFVEKTAQGVEHVQLQDALEALLNHAPHCTEWRWQGALTEARNVLKSLEDADEQP